MQMLEGRRKKMISNVHLHACCYVDLDDLWPGIFQVQALNWHWVQIERRSCAACENLNTLVEHPMLVD